MTKTRQGTFRLSGRKRLKTLWATPERISFDLDTTQEIKFRSLGRHIEPHVLVWSDRLKPEKKQVGAARFYLLPPLKRWMPFPLLVLYPFIIFPILLYLLLKYRFDVVLVRPGLEGIVCASLRRWGRPFGLRFGLLVEAFGDWMEVALVGRKGLMRQVFYYALRLMSGFSINSADMLRAESTSTMEKMRRFAPDKPFAVFPRVHLELFLKLAVAEERLNPEEFNIIYIGELIPLKGVHYLIQALNNIIAQSPQAHLTIVGEGKCRPDLEKMAEDMNLQDSIEFTSYLPPEKVKERMVQSDLLVLPSMTEGLPRVIIEAMAVGLPIIATDVGSVRELVADGKNGYLIKPSDVAALTRALLAMASDRARAKQMGLESKKLIERAGDLYNMAGYARRYIDTLYRTYEQVERIEERKQV